MACDGLPDTGVLFELNSFLYLWSMEDEQASMQSVPRYCEIVIYVSISFIKLPIGTNLFNHD